MNQVTAERQRSDASGVNLRKTHPTLYRTYMTFALISIGLGLNFLLTNPTFNPYHIDKAIIGSIFVFIGLIKLVFLNIFRHLRLIRIALAINIAFMIFWGVGSSFTFFQGKTSLQLFVLYIGLSALELWLLQESPVNPMTEKERS